MRRILGNAVLLAGVALFALGPGSAAGSTGDASVSALLRDANGLVIGQVTFQPTSSGSVGVAARVRGLTPGFHGFHVHAVGQCVPPFTSAGGHLGTAGSNHADHAGDMPVLLVRTTGASSLTFETDRFTLRQLFDADGSAVIVHAVADNYANIPARYTSSTTGQPGPDAATLTTGDSGGRVACGVVTKR